jgi:RNA polymerase sigma-70 factor, ECF subfamily
MRRRIAESRVELRVRRDVMDGQAGELCLRGFLPTWLEPRVAGARASMSEPPFDAKSDDRALVEAAVAGRRAAFDVIVERYRRSVYQVCYRFVGDHEDASDLTQDAFIRAYRALGTFKGESALGTWLYRIAVNVCLNRLALRAPAHETLSDQITETRGERPDEPVMRAERAALVRAAIAQLPTKQRATLILRVYHDLPHAEIARVLGSSVGAAKANFFHALHNLKRLLSGGPLGGDRGPLGGDQ